MPSGRNKKSGQAANLATTPRNVVAYDGPPDSSQGSRGRSPSAGPARSGPLARSQSRGRQNVGPPAETIVLSRNVDFGGNAYNLGNDVSLFTFPST